MKALSLTIQELWQIPKGFFFLANRETDKQTQLKLCPKLFDWGGAHKNVENTGIISQFFIRQYLFVCIDALNLVMVKVL